LQKYFKIVVLIYLLGWSQLTFAQDTIPLNTYYSFEASYAPGYSYSWWYVDDAENKTYFTSSTNKTEDYYWDSEGEYQLFVQAKDSNNCLSEIISKPFIVKEIVIEKDTTDIYAIPDIIISVEGETVVGNVATNDFLFPQDTSEIVYSLVGEPLPGLTFNPDGTFIYEPAEVVPGKYFFTYQLCFEALPDVCTTAEVELRIISGNAAENYKPIAVTDVVLTLTNQAVSSNVLLNDINYFIYESSVFTLSDIPVVPPQNGSLELLSDGTFTYIPDPGFTGDDKFMYQLCNNKEPYLCDSAWVYIYVNEFNYEEQSPPLSVSDDVIVFKEDTIFSVAANDFSLDGQALVYSTTPVEGTKYGTLQILEDGSFKYNPNPGFTGVDRFVYEVCGTKAPVSCRRSTAYIVMGEEESVITVEAGRDTTIGSCFPYQLEATVSDTTGVSYRWEPSAQLDDPESARPVFTPGMSTTFIVSVSNSKGAMASDTVEINVAEIVADAGEDILIDRNTTAILDGSKSVGQGLEYFWTTENGMIESGENTPTPIISGFGIYYLQLRDSFACEAYDSVEVSLITYAPIANDDYDTTSFQVAVNINVLANDEDPDGDLDPTSLSIVQYPVNGTAYINYNDYTITYTPEDGFTGGDVFEYKICDLTNKCDNAHVYVVVNNFKFLIPNAFTPNGDNINDYFEILGIEFYPGNSLAVINRWGKKVYEAKNYGIDTDPIFWDGKSNTGVVNGNNELPAGTYFYILDLGTGQKPIAGSVYIDR